MNNFGLHRISKDTSILGGLKRVKKKFSFSAK